ncbi:MAG: hypothetical protein IKW85_08400 [Muribaculaceae bacterium]|nr:hypothetical protein [Muribaculaceae bacterium]
MKRTITLIALVAALLIPSMAAAQRMPVKSNMRLSQFKAPAAAPARAEEEPIMDTPEGTLYDNMYAQSFAYGLGWGDIYIQNVDGGIGKVVEGTDGNLYIYNPISQGYIWFSILPWIKAESAGDGKYVVKLPQLYILDYGDPYYAYCMHYDEDEGMPVVEEEGEIEFTWENGVLTQLGDKYIGLCDATADWFYMADQHIVYAPQTDESITLSGDDMYIQSYTLTYLSDPTDLTKTKETVVSVAIDGEDIYMGNLNNNNPDSFIKGTLVDGKATFPTRQYLGVDAYYNGHIYVLTGDAFVDTETYGTPVFNYNLNNEIVFNVDEDARNIVAEWPAAMVTNVGPTTLSIINDYVAPALVAFDEVAAVPATPVFTDDDLTVNNASGWAVLHFTIPTVDVDGNKLNENKLFYNIYLDGEVFTFDPEDYIGLSSAMTDIPYKFEDNINFDIYMSGNGRHTVYIYTTDFDKVGVQSIYTAGDEVNRSEVVYVDNPNLSGINEIANGAQVVGIRYFDLTGRELPTAPATGLYLQLATYSDGTTTATKVMK